MAVTRASGLNLRGDRDRDLRLWPDVQVVACVASLQSASVTSIAATVGSPEADLWLAIGHANLTGRTLTMTCTGLSFTEERMADAGALTMGVWWAPGVTESAAGARTFTLGGVASTSGALIVVGLRYAHQTSPIAVASSAPAVSSSTSPVVTGMTGLPARALAVVYLALADDNSPTLATSGWSNIVESNYGISRSLAASFRSFPTGGDTGDITYTEAQNGPDAGQAVTVAIAAA